MITTQVVTRYSSRGRIITRSNNVKDLWVITCTDRISWFSITCSQEEILKLNPPDSIVWQTTNTRPVYDTQGATLYGYIR